MRASPLLFVFVAFYHVKHARTDNVPDVECSKGSKSPAMTLKKQLFCSYDSTVRPAKDHANTTDVSMILWLKFLVFNEHYNTLEVHSWVVWKWRDEHLTWDKSEHSNIAELKLMSTEIWVPDVTVYNAGSLDSTDTGLPETRCTVDFTGLVSCVSPTVYVALCVPDVVMWPFDSHICSTKVGSWSHTASQINLTLDRKGIDTRSYSENREWEMVASNASLEKTSYENETHPWINFTFDLRRHPGGRAATVVVPAVVLAVITLVTFWMNADSAQRLGLICVNIVCHCLYMIFLGAMMPANGDATPVIVTFFRDSFLLAGVSLVVTLCAARMNAAVEAPPSWMSVISNGVLMFAPVQYLLLGETNPKAVAAALGASGGEDSADLVGGSHTPTGWRLFSTLLDRVFFIVCLLTLFILLCAYIP